jgi:hypothetical protein
MRLAVVERFGWDAIANQTLDVYRQVCPAAFAVGGQVESYAAQAANAVKHETSHVQERSRRYSSIRRNNTNAISVKLGARLSFHIARPDNGDSTCLVAFKANSLSGESLRPLRTPDSPAELSLLKTTISVFAVYLYKVSICGSTHPVVPWMLAAPAV